MGSVGQAEKSLPHHPVCIRPSCRAPYLRPDIIFHRNSSIRLANDILPLQEVPFTLLVGPDGVGKKDPRMHNRRPARQWQPPLADRTRRRHFEPGTTRPSLPLLCGCFVVCFSVGKIPAPLSRGGESRRRSRSSAPGLARPAPAAMSAPPTPGRGWSRRHAAR